MKREHLILIFIVAGLLLFYGNVFLTYFNPRYQTVQFPSSWSEVKWTVRLDDTPAFIKSSGKLSYGEVTVQNNKIIVPIIVEEFEPRDRGAQVRIDVWVTVQTIMYGEGIVKVKPQPLKANYNGDNKLNFTSNTWYSYVEIGDVKTSLQKPEIIIVNGKAEVNFNQHMVLWLNKIGSGEIIIQPSTWETWQVQEVNVKVYVNNIPAEKASITPSSHKISSNEFVVPLYLGENKFTVTYYGFQKEYTFNLNLFSDNAIPSSLAVNFKVPTVKVRLEGNGYLAKTLYLHASFYTDQDKFVYRKTFTLKVDTQLPIEKQVLAKAVKCKMFLTEQIDSGQVLVEAALDLSRQTSTTLQIPSKYIKSTSTATVKEVSFTVTVKTESGRLVKNCPVQVLSEDKKVIASTKTNYKGEAKITISELDLPVYVRIDVDGHYIYYRETPHHISDGAKLTFTIPDKTTRYKPPERIQPDGEPTEIDFQDPVKIKTGGELQENIKANVTEEKEGFKPDWTYILTMILIAVTFLIIFRRRVGR